MSDDDRDEVLSTHSDEQTRDKSPEANSAHRRERSRSRDDERRRRRSASHERRRERSRSKERRRRRSPSPKRSRRDRDDERRRRSRSRSRDDTSRSRKHVSPSPPPKEKVAEKEPEPPKKEPVDLLRTRTGGAYIPPAKLKLMQEQLADKGGEQYQRMNWERLKKKMHGLVNRVNTDNLVTIVRELLQENIIRGKGLLARSIIQAQSFSPTFSHVYAALVAVINSKFPHIGELILRRLVVQFKRSFRRNDKGVTVTVVKFIAHLINQQVAHEVLALEIMILMLETPTDDSVEVAIAFIKECGAKMMELSPRALESIYNRLRAVLMDSRAENSDLDKRVQYMIEVAMQIRKEKFAAYPAVVEALDLIDEEDQITHQVTLEEAVNPENELNVFKFDPEFEKSEAMYDEIRSEVIGDADDDDDEDEDEDQEGGGDNDEEGEGAAPQASSTSATTEIIDNTEQNLVAFRREVYLTIQSSLEYQEAAHKLLKMRVKPELEIELCHMMVDCCAQQRTYERFYGMLCERFCRLKREFQETFEQVARDTYATVHRFDITKLRNMSKLIAHLLFTDAISWNVLSDIKLTEDDTTSSGRIYIKYIFQELVEHMGLVKLYDRTRDPTLQQAFAGIFPRDNPANARFAINFFTLIGLGGLTLDLREFLAKGMKKKSEEAALEDTSSSSSSDDSDSDSSDSDDSDSDSDDSDSSSSSDSSDDDKKKKKKSSSKKGKKDEKENKRQSDKKKSRESESARVKEEVPSPKGSPSPPPRRRRNEDDREEHRGDGGRKDERRHRDEPDRDRDEERGRRDDGKRDSRRCRDSGERREERGGRREQKDEREEKKEKHSRDDERDKGRDRSRERGEKRGGRERDEKRHRNEDRRRRRSIS